jgi:hypothetical protein
VQLSCVVDPEVVFHKDYPYSTGNTGALRANFEDLAKDAAKFALPGDLVVDIGANDGTLLDCLPDNLRLLAVEPTDQILGCAAKGIDSVQGFFSSDMARLIRSHHGPAKVVTACNVLAHVEDIHDVLDGIVELLDDDGVLITENHSLESVVKGLQWDTVYHEHLRFYTPESLRRLLAGHGLNLMWWHPIPTHGGSFRVGARAAAPVRSKPISVEPDMAAFAASVAQCRTAIRETVADCRRTGARVFGVGAAARAATVINYCGFDVADVEVVCEVPQSDKIGHYMPGTRIPVVDEARLFDEQPEFALLFSWHVADAIVPKLRASGYQGQFIVPLPTVRVV